MEVKKLTFVWSRVFCLLLLLLAQAGYSQALKTITGKVSDSTGAGLSNVSVKIVGKTTGVVSAEEGSYSIRAAEGDELEYSSIGYAIERKNVGSSNVIDVTLFALAESAGADVVVTALGIRREERALSYSAQQISAKDLTAVKDANFVNSLQGKVAGVTINTSSSGVGGATKVVMRGTKSIAKGNNALYVIDGVPMFNITGDQGSGRFASGGSSEGIADLNSEDIESLTVLTGASAAALYGSDAANGVILVTTKKGKEGRLSVNVSSQADFMNPFVLPRFQSVYGNRPGEIRSWGDSLPAGKHYNPANFFNTGMSWINSVSLSTGTQKNQTFFSASSTNANGIVPNNIYDRYNFTFRNTASFLNDKITLDLGANYIMQSGRNMRNQGEYFNPIVPVYLFPRAEDFGAVRAFEHFDEGRQISKPYWPYEEGGYSMMNPYWTAYRIVNTSQKDRYILTGSLKYEILPWLNVSTRTRFDNTTSGMEGKRFAGTLTQFTGGSENGFYEHATGTEKQLYMDGMISVNKTINDYSVNINTGGIYSDMLNNTRDGFRGPLREDGVPNFWSPYNQRYTGQDANAIPSYSALRTYSLFFSGELGWKRMLYLTLTARNDWSSPLVNTSSESKGFFYPSVGLSGVISQMAELPDFVSFLKLRTSYAEVGNPPSAGLTSPTYSYNVQTGIWAPPSYMPIETLYPERTTSWEAGMNAKFLRNRISLDITYYHSNTFKQTFNPAISASSGFSSRYIQTGNIQNRGIEAVLGYGDTYAGDFSYDTRVTFSANRNKIIELADAYTDPGTGETKSIEELRMGGLSDAQFILRKGGTLGDLYAFSDIKRDENGQILVNASTGSIFSEGNQERFLGTVFPKCNLGWNNEFSYKGINLGFLISARIGGIVLSSTQAVLDNFGVSQSSADWRAKGGIPVNNGVVSAEKWFDVVAASQGMMAYYTYSATNARLQEMHINYQLPKKWFRNVAGITVGLNARNLFMIYNKAPFDPEATASTGNFYQGLDYFMMPSLKNMGFNIKVQF